MNDGTFGVTGNVPPFESDLIDRLENHSFDQVGVLQWRNRKLDFSSIERLKDSLRETPDHRRLARSRMVDDVIALENVSHDPAVRDMATRTGGGRAVVGDVPDPGLPEDLRGEPCRARRHALSASS